MTTAPLASGTQADTGTFPNRTGDSGAPRPRRSSAKAWLACGIFLLVLGIYALSGPGRIDTIDGEVRFDVAFNWLAYGRPIVTDQWIGPGMSVPGREGLHYSYYGAPASIVAIPLVWLGLRTGPPPGIQASQFLFSLTSSLFGAAIAPLLFLFYLELGVATRRAFAWTMVSSFATYIWAISTSTLDNAQHAFFCLAAVYFGYVAARRKSTAYAVIGGTLAGVLIMYQEYFLLIIPALALSTLQWNSEAESTAPGTESLLGRLQFAVSRTFQALLTLIRSAWSGPGEARSSCRRYCLFLAGVAVGLFLSLAYNHLRFGSWLDNGDLRFAAQRDHPIWGNPLIGFLTLLLSPGKSIFLYSPVLVLALIGVGRLWRRSPALVAMIAGSSVTLVLFLSCIAFAGGDWCWGPRYLTPLLPLWALAFPFTRELKLRRSLVVGLIAIGFLVQALALSAENQRFFFARGVDDYFWAEHPWFYFQHSALFARVGETLSLFDGVPGSARYFNSIPIPDWTTYSLLGPPPSVPRRLAPLWMRNFKIFYLPRPWPLWMSSLPPARRPVQFGAWLAVFLTMASLGAGLAYSHLKKTSA